MNGDEIKKRRNEARDEIKRRISCKDYLTKSKGGLYVCPYCHSGTGSHKTGALKLYEDTNSWCCHSCKRTGDVIDLYQQQTGADYDTALSLLTQEIGVTIPSKTSGRTERSQDSHTSPQKPPKPFKQEAEIDYTDFFLQANRALDRTNYHRGISRPTLDRFCVGYVPDWTHPKAPNAQPTPRLIIPTSQSSYLARDARDIIPDNQKQYSKSKVGRIHFLNHEAFQNSDKPIFIVEGELDALSIIDAGGEAVGLGSKNMVKKLLALLKEQKPVQPLVIALDNDESGKNATKELIDGLEALNIAFYEMNPAGRYKDANEALQKDPDALRQAVDEVNHLQDAAEQAAREAYLKTSTAHYLQDFADGITASAATDAIPTGFGELDAVLDGGLYEGLYIIGGISSLGKTTIVMQIADQIAASGRDVLIFSLEMSRMELMSKSISRHTYQAVISTGGDTRNAKTARGITAGSRYKHYSQTERDYISLAIDTYSQYADHIFISEGVGDIGAAQIRDTVERHISFTGNIPVVIIDYLQILAPYNDRATDKQNTDKAVLELKRISRDFKLPVIGISSFNRANYRIEVSMEAFKESGAIEYSSDVLLGLQLEGAGEKDFNAKEAKKKNPREIELVVLKNRYGKIGDTLQFRYFPMFNYLEEYIQPEYGIQVGSNTVRL